MREATSQNRSRDVREASFSETIAITCSTRPRQTRHSPKAALDTQADATATLPSLRTTGPCDTQPTRPNTTAAARPLARSAAAHIPKARLTRMHTSTSRYTPSTVPGAGGSGRALRTRHPMAASGPPRQPGISGCTNNSYTAKPRTPSTVPSAGGSGRARAGLDSRHPTAPPAAAATLALGLCKPYCYMLNSCFWMFERRKRHMQPAKIQAQARRPNGCLSYLAAALRFAAKRRASILSSKECLI